MDIFQIDKSNVGVVAELMSSIKPDWWDFEGASQQLQDVSLLAKLIGWYVGESILIILNSMVFHQRALSQIVMEKIIMVLS